MSRMMMLFAAVAYEVRLNLLKAYYDLKDFPLFGSEEHAAVALAAAEESLVC